MTVDSLFIQLYLDEDVSVLLADLLGRHGFDVLCARDANNRGKSDTFQLEYATAHQRTLLTHNRQDFQTLHRKALLEQSVHHGIIIANRRASDMELAKRTMKVLDFYASDEMKGQLLYI